MGSNRFPLIVGTALLSLMLVGAVSASYPMFHYNGQRTGYVPEDGPQNNTILWKANLGEFIGAPPVVESGRVYIGTWPDMAFGADEEYYLLCLNASTGREIWRNPLGAGEGTVSGAAVSRGRLYAGCMDGNLYCIDTADGTTLWSVPVDTGRGGGNWYGLSCSPVAYDDMVLVTSLTDGTLHAFDPDGNEAWTYTTGNATFAYSSPAVDAAGRAYFAGNAVADALYCIDIATGEEIWNITTDGQIRSSPAISGSTVYAVSANRLYALDTGNEDEVWNRSVSASWGTPAVAGGRLYLGTADGIMHCYDAETGEEEWTFTASGRIDASPVVANDTVYFASNTATATIYAVDTAGNEIWRYVTTNYLQSSPSVSGGTLYIGSDEGTLYAFGDGQVPEPAFSGWSGSVRLAEGETFTVTPLNNASVTYTVNRTSALGALDAAATKGNFNYTLKEETWGSFLYSIGGIAYNETSWDSWLYSVNGVTADVEAADYPLSDGDVVTYWYGAWDSSPDTAGAVISITVSVPITPTPTPGLWNGTVALTEGETFTVTPLNNESAVYTVNRTSALGALDAAATKGNFNYTLKEESWGSFLYSIGNFAYNETSWDSWLFMVNGVTAGVGAADYQLADGDVIAYWYGGWGSSPETAGAVISITVSIQSPTPTPGGGDGGGDSPSAWITVTLQPGTFNITAANSGKTYTVDRQTALGALHAAGTAYTIDDSFYREYGSLFLNSVRGRAGEGTKGWMYQVNGESPAVGSNTYMVANGDEVVFFWSEGMSSTPATSPDVISIKVVISKSDGGSGSSSSGGSSGLSGTTASGSGEPGAATPSFFFGLPVGAAVEFGEWGQIFSFDTAGRNTSAEQVTVSGNSFIIKRNGLTIVLAARNINEKDGTATGLIESVTASIEPVTANISTIGTVAASLDLNLTGIPGDGRIEISLNETPDAGTASAFHLAAAENGKEIDALAYTVTVTRTNLENGEDIAGAVIRMTVSPAWVEEHGGPDAVRIVRSAEDSRYEILDTRLTGIDGNGNLIFEGISPGGLSVFGLLTVTAAPAAQEYSVSTATTTTTATPAAAGTPTGAPPSLSSQLIAAGVGAILIIGAVYLVIERRRKQ